MNGDRIKNVICFVAMLVIFAMALIIDRAEVTLEIRYLAYAISAVGLICLSVLIRKPLSIRSGSLVLEHLGDQADPLMAWEEELAQQQETMEVLARQLDQRHTNLTQKLIAFHEWSEFPVPIDMDEGLQAAVARGDLPEDDVLVELMEKDRQTIVFLEQQAKRVFENILQNKYTIEGQLQVRMLRNEALSIAESVARIYQPTAEFPLMETSAEQIMFAASRVCLQTLVVMDELPLNVKQMNIQSLYGYISKAVKAYGVYKKAKPLLNYASGAVYAGRFAWGANPVATGAMWLLQNVGKKTASEVAGKYLNEQAMGLLSNVIHAIGFEAAQIYGGDFRHRDSNWIYGIELVETVNHFQFDRESLIAALEELGALKLRSEYDRAFLYRCVAVGKSPDSRRYRAAKILTEEQKQAIYLKIGEYLKIHYQGLDAGKIEGWRTRLRKHLDFKS
ncbi:MAG: hypothetical protein CMJ76_05115 [Planctomycetaceae bacterium]|nr:hypothetical protein [Planctomycetaceae bacterium]|tara:strand:+ start:2260 stop:3603 length:1344 start_codon:yes stop_codon:yes gene_type:complete